MTVSVLAFSVHDEVLQFLSRKTGLPAEIIRAELADVAYYLGRREIRDLVLNIVREEVKSKTSPGDSLVVIGHSLGSVVAYDSLRPGTIVPSRIAPSSFSSLRAAR